MADNPPAGPALPDEPVDSGAVLATYPSLFNNGDGAGLHALLSEKMKSHNTIDSLNDELATASSNGYVIDDIQVIDQVIEEDSAILETEIYWTIGGSAVTSSPTIFLVYENDQWKLDNLVLSPED